MCVDPFTAAMIAGTAISAGGSLMQGQQAEQMGEMQAQAYQQQAQNDAQATAFEVSRERRRQELAASAARAAVGASGVAMTGSPTEVMVANAREGQLDIATMRHNSVVRRAGLENQAAISTWQGKQAKTASYFTAASTFVSGISQLYDPNRAVKMGTTAFSPRASAAIATGNGGLY